MKSALRQNFINHYDRLLADPVLLVKESALPQRDPHGLQIVRRYQIEQRQGQLVRRRCAAVVQ